MGRGPKPTRRCLVPRDGPAGFWRVALDRRTLCRRRRAVSRPETMHRAGRAERRGGRPGKRNDEVLDGIGLEIFLIFLMILANGIFAMSEIAVVSARRARLQGRAEQGDAGARRALELAEHPTRFLSTVQIGITLVGIFAGAYGGATIARHLDESLQQVPWLAPYSAEISLTLVVVVITYLSLVIGELVPKRIALTNPERVASLVAGPMNTLSILAAPLVKVLGVSTDLLVRVLGIRKGAEPPVTEAEVSALLEQGAEAGVFEEEEQDIVERVFWLADQRASALMTPRRRIVYLDIQDSEDEIRATIAANRFSRFLVCDGQVDRVLGMVDARDLLASMIARGRIDLESLMTKPLFVPEGMRALRLLEMFRESGVHMAVVVDEYGGVEGIVTLNDVLEEIAGEMVSPVDSMIVERADGSWLVDGATPMYDLWEALGMEEPREAQGDYNTVAGFVFAQLGHVPTAGESFQFQDLRLEVVDMDGKRIDKVLIARAPVDEGTAGVA